MADTYSEITLWRSPRRFAWKPWTAEFEDDRWAYAVDTWTRWGAMRRATAWRTALVLEAAREARRG